VPLLYQPFASSSRLVAAARSNPPLAQGAHGPAVLLIQGALIDLGFKLPRSTVKTGTPDGIFGRETTKVLGEYQTSRKLKKVDGILGRDTLLTLDKDMMANAHPVPLKPPVPVPPPGDPEYTVGTADPPLTPDPGAGSWRSKPAESTYISLRAAIVLGLPASAVVIGDDAAAHMLHYLQNSGANYEIDLAGMVNDVPSAKRRYEREVSQAQSFVEKLASGTYDITSIHTEVGYNRKEENKNWFYAIGGYHTWGKGTVVVEDSGGQRSYRMEYEYKFYDRYNWDGGKQVKIGDIVITDHFMGEFHRQGIAREFDCLGSFKRRLAWRQGELIANQQLYQEIGGRT
jgi:peptidoglycan hydrolase-like protein with peptidoglycan-binding domain